MSSSFLQQLRHWSFHVTLCAIPSFLIAVDCGFKKTECIVAMILGILAYILIWACFGTLLLRSPLSAQSRQALCWGTRARTLISMFGLSGFLHKDLSWMIYPDFASGAFAMIVTENVRASVRVIGLAGSEMQKSFLSAFVPTLIEGAVFSLSLIPLSLLAYAIIRFSLRQVTTVNLDERNDQPIR